MAAVILQLHFGILKFGKFLPVFLNFLLEPDSQIAGWNFVPRLPGKAFGVDRHRLVFDVAIDSPWSNVCPLGYF
jgi:hypothetical protein